MVDAGEKLGSRARIPPERSQYSARDGARTHLLNATHAHAHVSTVNALARSHSASTTTPTPSQSTAFMMFSAISRVIRSCSCNRRQEISAMRASLLRPSTLPRGM